MVEFHNPYVKAGNYAKEKDFSIRHAFRWMPPYDLERKKEHLRDLPEYEFIELEIGGIIGIEDKHG